MKKKKRGEEEEEEGGTILEECLIPIAARESTAIDIYRYIDIYCECSLRSIEYKRERESERKKIDCV